MGWQTVTTSAKWFQRVCSGPVRVRTVTDFWTSFVPQLLAALVGAFAGVAGVLIGFRLQRRAARSDSVDDAVERLLIRLSEFAEESKIYANHHRFFFAVPLNSPPPAGPARPVGYAVSIAFEILSMRTTGRERREANDISLIWSDILHAPGAADAATAAGLLAGLVASWRRGTLENLSERAAMIRSLAVDKIVIEEDSE